MTIFNHWILGLHSKTKETFRESSEPWPRSDENNQAAIGTTQGAQR